MSMAFTSITINTAHLQDMLNFYTVIGFHFDVHSVKLGNVVHRAHYQGFEFSLCSINKEIRTHIPSLQLGFTVSNIDAVVSQLNKVPGAMSILDPTDMEEGRRAIVLDPDGHSVDLCQTSA